MTNPIPRIPKTRGTSDIAVPEREYLNGERNALTHRFQVEGHKAYVTVGLFDDGRPGEVFLKMAKQGATLSGFADAWAIQVSLALQYGIPLQRLLEKHIGGRFPPHGLVIDHFDDGEPKKPGDVKTASSVLDYVARWMLHRFPSRVSEAPDPAPTQTDPSEAPPASESLDDRPTSAAAPVAACCHPDNHEWHRPDESGDADCKHCRCYRDAAGVVRNGSTMVIQPASAAPVVATAGPPCVHNFVSVELDEQSKGGLEPVDGTATCNKCGAIHEFNGTIHPPSQQPGQPRNGGDFLAEWSER